MDITLTLAYAIFIFTAAITPGPNNILLMSSGAVFGFKPTIPHVLGVALGFNFLLFFVVLGFGKIFQTYPHIFTITKYLGIAWLLWMSLKYFKTALKAYRLNSAGENSSEQSKAKGQKMRPFRFHEAVLFQLINPKAIIMMMAATAAYSGVATNLPLRLMLLVGISLISGLISSTSWAYAGAGINRLLTNPKYAPSINGLIGVLWIGTAAMIYMAKGTP